ncbi:MAG TPA: serine kinase [Magnetospirillum sp.]|nr:serine kinase [Magnetospirillum sp.]
MDYLLCGWRVRSEVPLPEVCPWAGDDRQPDITVRLGCAPALDRPVDVSPYLQIGRDGDCRLSIETVGSFLVRHGREVVIEPAAASTAPEIRLLLLGTVLGLLSHQRGLCPLHASCVRVGDAALAFAGPSGAGKSTFATMLAQRGYALMADDVCVVDPHAAGGPVVLPAFPRVKLWQDSLDALSIGTAGLDRNRPSQRKYHYTLTQPGGFAAEPVPLRAVYLLDDTRSPQAEEIEYASGFEAISLLSGQIFRRTAAATLGRERELFQAVSTLAATVKVGRLFRHKRMDRLDLGAGLIETEWVRP